MKNNEKYTVGYSVLNPATNSDSDSTKSNGAVSSRVSYGLFPLNLGIFGIVDGVSLFTSMVVLLLNKFIYVIIVDYLPLGRLGNYVINDITFT